MIKKTTAYLLMILANIVLLAHAVVPHHHHHEQVCIESTCCQANVSDHEHKLPQDNHQHEDNENSSACILKQAVFLPSNLGKQDRGYIECHDSQYHFFLITLNIALAETGLHEVCKAVFDTEFTFSYTDYVTGSLGLRAPPTV